MNPSSLFPSEAGVYPVQCIEFLPVGRIRELQSPRLPCPSDILTPYPLPTSLAVRRSWFPLHVLSATGPG